MKAAAANLDFERAAALRDQVRALKTHELGLGASRTAAAAPSQGDAGHDAGGPGGRGVSPAA
jgi:hypothetical protein